MQNFLNFIKENYSYFVYVIEFVLAFVFAFISFLKSKRVSKLERHNSFLDDMFVDRGKYLSLYMLLPEFIRKANILYPNHGDGEKRFEFVYQKVISDLRFDDSMDLRALVYGAVDSILYADKFEKISRDTLDVEPKKEFYEKAENETEERSEGLLQNVQKDESNQCCTGYVPRRN